MPNPYTGELNAYETFNQQNPQMGAKPMGEPASAEEIDAKIKELTGDDKAYETKLKEHASKYLGYVNYKKQQAGLPGAADPGMKAKMGGGVESSYLRGNITPGGVKSLVGAGIGMRNQEQTALTSKASGSKTASEKARVEATDLLFNSLKDREPKDAFEREVQMWAANPRTSEGHFKSVDQLKQQLKDAVLGGDAQWTQEEVDAKLDQMIPPALQEDLQENYYKSLGYTNAEADNLVKYDRYASGDMPEDEAELYRLTDPTWAAKAEAAKTMPGLQSELDKIKGNSPDAPTFTELQSQYPEIDPAAVKPYYRTAALEDINGMMQQPENEGFDPIIVEGGEVNALSFDFFLDGVKPISKTLSTVYQGILTSAEIDYLMYEYYNERVRTAEANFQQQQGEVR